MKFKLDENLGRSVKSQMLVAGYDVVTVADQGMKGTSDDILIRVCQSEQRCLVTLDMGFANPFVYLPTNYAGIAVIRLPKEQTPADLHSAITNLLNGLKSAEITGQLWTISKGRIRRYKTDEDLH